MKKIIIVSVFILLILIFINYILIDKDIKANFVVKIESYCGDYSKEGHGFVYKIENNQYYIVTNNHVISEAESINIVNYKGIKKTVDIINYDKYTDIAVLKVDNIDLNISNINYSFNLNDEVYVWGPKRETLFKKKIKGIILEENKIVNVSGSSFDAISIDIDIGSGYSGSPLINNIGEVIGMVSVKEKDIVYAIPIKKVMEIANLLEKGEIIRPNLGATFVDTKNKNTNEEVSEVEGIIVSNIVEDYPLYEAGVLENSIITKVEGVRVYNIYDLMREVYKHNIGDTISIECYNNFEYENYTVVLDE